MKVPILFSQHAHRTLTGQKLYFKRVLPLFSKPYFGLKYPITIYPDDQGGYVSEIKDIPGCFTQGETREETLISKQ
ncbi:MAG: type II toxin-antitoxin system HicB family antitoxin [Microcystis aeruginosa Ma_QC_Ca_00000000_S207]|uniref:Type II toxin-antitoxin system HicB family antitoxin n=1 Tax=Microcystis aeruginosa Ma_QC_Ca_00000000_S207 TaxID=2486251 RepID=A0A552FYX6_MICAE|nr:MAG: type II toxin-antitoxin system HicB family antitoxin [Microcystis aeruginosa Ma_QC_Ca_00000000_S207]